MLATTVRTKVGAFLVALLVACGPSAAMVALTASLTASLAGDAEARSRSSGGYSRPSGGFSVRTPSVGGGFSRSRTPSSSGGYDRPSGGGGFSFGFPSSPGDTALSRRSAGEALSRYRARQEPPAAPSAPSAGGGIAGPWSSGGGGGIRVPRSGDGGAGFGRGSGWFDRQGWSIPRYAYGSRSSFGLWDGLFLWFMLDSLTDSAHAAWFHNHQDDPGYQAWRSDAERLAQDNADLRGKLDTLDRRMAEMQGQPRDPNYLPPDVPPEAALADDASRRTPTLPVSADAGIGVLPIVLGVGGGALFLLWRARRQAAGGAGRSAGGPTVGKIRSAAGILRHKVSGEGYSPTLFRVGMTITLDPTPFILAQGATKVSLPDVAGGNTLVSVAGVGTVTAEGATFYRLHLPEGHGFFQLHLDPNGQPDECRFFQPFDTVVPASEDEWDFWLDPQEGMIGWPEFQAKDGKLYGRVWAPGPGRAAPRKLSETVNELSGLRLRSQEAMLYGAPTGLAPPAPEIEYILVALEEEEGRAWIAIHAGIDVNPAALSLS